MQVHADSDRSQDQKGKPRDEEGEQHWRTLGAEYTGSRAISSPALPVLSVFLTKCHRVIIRSFFKP